MNLLSFDIVKKIFSGSERTALIKKNIAGSLVLKGISILISFIVVPITINFINPTRYGVWLTLSSLMAWFNFFDVGLTLGFRNRFAESKAKGETELARIYVSTTYASLLILFGTMLVVVLPINTFVDWSSILNISQEYREELSLVFGIMIFFFSCGIILQVLTTLITADQRPAISSLIQVTGQAVACLIIFILTKVMGSGNLVSLALIFSGTPIVIVLIASLFFYSRRYKAYSPHWRYVKFRYVKDILGLGGKFFIITTSMLFIFQLMNVIISRNIAPESVTQYNISYKYFYAVYMIASLIIAPFWSAFTDAYTRKDFTWMTNSMRKLQTMWLFIFPVMLLMYLLAPFFYKIWLENTVEIPNIINICMVIYIPIITLAAIYMQLINGTGKVTIQLIIYIIFACIAYPIMDWGCKNFGIPGLLAIPCVVFGIQAIIGKIQLVKIINNSAKGIWDK